MTIMMSDSLVGRINPRSLVSDKPHVDSYTFSALITFKNESFTFPILEFKKKSKKTTISFFSSDSFVERVMRDSFSMSMTLMGGREEIFTFPKVDQTNCRVKVKLNSPEKHTVLSILSV